LTQVVYVDTDTIFLAPPKDLWALFSKMNSSHLAGLTFEHENKTSGWYSQFAKHPYYGQAGLNSGVMLMSLEGIRSLDTWSKELSAILYKYESKFVWGDQDVLNVFFNHHPEKLLPLPCHWNYRHDHCTASGHCWESGVHGVSLLHGNKGMFLNPEGAEFKIIYDILNQLQLRDILSSQVSLKRVFIDKTISSLINHSKSICGSLLARSLYERRPKNTSSG
jgi:UDP-xylose:glucoside alpha-1,3-xylosyltransferase